MIPVLNKNSGFEASELENGFLILINKNVGWTSFDVVKKIRNVLGFKKVGHAGTLDPFATGLLILGVGRGAKELGSLSGLSKKYEAVIHLGVETDSYDVTGEIQFQKKIESLSESKLKENVNSLTGDLLQVPPMFSAKQVNGKRLYKLARKKIEIERDPVPVTIHSADIVSWNNPFLNISLHVSKGTYIRAYAHDLGEILGTGGHLQKLERTQIGGYSLEDSFKIEEFIETWQKLKKH